VSLAVAAGWLATGGAACDGLGDLSNDQPRVHIFPIAGDFGPAHKT
jgi:hypothetical protein